MNFTVEVSFCVRRKIQRLDEVCAYSIKPVLRFAQSRREMASVHPVFGKGWGHQARLGVGILSNYVCVTVVQPDSLA